MNKLRTKIQEENIDKGILPAVRILRNHGFETFESCEGGVGHAFEEAVILFEGDEFDCIRVYELCLQHNMNVDYTARIFQKDSKERGIWEKPYNKIAFTKHPKTGTIFRP